MSDPHGFDPEDGEGFDVDDWQRLPAFTGRLATLEDVQARRAVFALDDTQGGRAVDMDLPQPVIWWEDDGEQAARSEEHTSELQSH